MFRPGFGSVPSGLGFPVALCQAAERRRDVDAERDRVRQSARAAQALVLAAAEVRRKDQQAARTMAKQRELANDDGWAARQDTRRCIAQLSLGLLW